MKNLVDDYKKRSSEIFAAKMDIFSEKTSSWSANNFTVLPNLAPGFRHSVVVVEIVVEMVVFRVYIA